MTLLGHPSPRTLMLALCVPNGLVVGCEAVWGPYAGDRAAPLFVAGRPPQPRLSASR